MTPRFNVILSTLILLAATTVQAQDKLLYGRVLDRFTSEPISHVAVEIQGKGVASDKQGLFAISYDVTERVELKLSHLAYVDRTIRGPFELGDTLEVFLRSAVITLTAPVVFADPKPDVVYESKTLHVAEFKVSDAGIWMLNYLKPRLLKREHEASQDIYDKVELVLLDTNMNVIDSEALPNGMLGMYKDHEGEILLKGKGGDLHAQYFNEHIILQELDAGVANERLSWNDSLSGKLLGSNFIEAYPAFDHYEYDREKNESRIIYEVEDEPLMDLFRSQIKYMSGRDRVVARNRELRSGIDKEIHAAWMSGFQSDKYYRPLYAPLFVQNDTIMIFDHYKDRITILAPSKGNQEVQANTELQFFEQPESEYIYVPIDYHLGRKGRAWEKELLHDKTREHIYVMFARNSVTWLERIETKTGKLFGRMELYYRYPEQVQVFDGFVYYVYREFGTSQKKTLYRERIKTSPVVQGSVSGSQTK